MKQDKEQIQLTSTLPYHLPIDTEEVVEALQDPKVVEAVVKSQKDFLLEDSNNLPSFYGGCKSFPMRVSPVTLEYQLKHKVRIPKGLTREEKREFILSAGDKVKDILVTGGTPEDVEGVLKELFSRNPKI